MPIMQEVVLRARRQPLPKMYEGQYIWAGMPPLAINRSNILPVRETDGIRTTFAHCNNGTFLKI